MVVGHPEVVLPLAEVERPQVFQVSAVGVRPEEPPQLDLERV
ncbi:MAG: hypothetical protein ACREQM_16180 [Candidatus Dormibacteraceae bacterium]